jgi:hypothetical protein
MSTSRTGAVLAATLLIVTACAHSVSGTPQAAPGTSPGEAACATVDVPFLDVESHSDSEPRVRIPQPPGWERWTNMDSEVIRAAMVNKSLSADGFTPNVVYTMDKVPGNTDPQTLFDEGRQTMVKMLGATDVQTSSGSVCGLPAETTHYTLAIPANVGPHPAVVRSVVITSGDSAYMVSLSMQSTHADEPTYARDSATILDGMQVLQPK